MLLKAHLSVEPYNILRRDDIVEGCKDWTYLLLVAGSALDGDCEELWAEKEIIILPMAAALLNMFYGVPFAKLMQRNGNRWKAWLFDLQRVPGGLCSNWTRLLRGRRVGCIRLCVCGRVCVFWGMCTGVGGCCLCLNVCVCAFCPSVHVFGCVACAFVSVYTLLCLPPNIWTSN